MVSTIATAYILSRPQTITPSFGCVAAWCRRVGARERSARSSRRIAASNRATKRLEKYQGTYRSSRAYGRRLTAWDGYRHHLCAAPAMGVSVRTALFSFEGTNLAASSTFRRSTAPAKCGISSAVVRLETSGRRVLKYARPRVTPPAVVSSLKTV